MSDNQSHLSFKEVREAFQKSPENLRWIRNTLDRAARTYDLSLSHDPFLAAEKLFLHLCRKSYREADALPLNMMSELKNRYDWTFSTTAWSLHEQIRREAEIISRAWKKLFALSETSPLFVILNVAAPVDYFTCALPPGASLFENSLHAPLSPILLYTELKISSSEHRMPLEKTSEGQGLEQAVEIAGKLRRQPVFLDFSRRRFPRAFLRVSRFAKHMGWGILPIEKVFDSRVIRKLPASKSPRGFAVTDGDPMLILFDPWCISDPRIVSHLTPKERKIYCHLPNTKPWQDDRIGARTEMEMGKDGIYRVTATPWVIPVHSGWMRVDEVFKCHLSEFIERCKMSIM